jgi:3-isopropylmalate dehydrogenase
MGHDFNSWWCGSLLDIHTARKLVPHQQATTLQVAISVVAAAMWMIKNPEWFDVIVTENMFGDIITDLGAMIQGGMGIAAGGNINPEGVSMFEPIGGSAPKYTGKNVINPLASICSGEMMMRTLGEEELAQALDTAVYKALESGRIKSLAAGQMGMSTSEVGDFVASLV